uniref:C2H2-type domain-containing protein n=1 Tax=Setaria digitata TaxID=48799 RepID=A0A915PM39_9BILA
MGSSSAGQVVPSAGVRGSQVVLRTGGAVGRMQQASESIEKEVTGGELENMVMEEDYLYETMDSTSGAHIERGQTTADDAYSEGPPVCEVYETIDERGINPSLESSTGSYDAYRPGSSFATRTTLPPHAKVMMLMKSNTPGEKPRLVKLEPVENPSKPDFRFAFETLRKCVKKNTHLQVPRTRKRRIIQPVVKKNKNTSSPSESKQMTVRSGRKDLKSEPTSDDESIESERNRRPRRAHKAPERYGDYIDETNRDAARLHLSDVPGFEPEAEEPEEGEESRRNHSASMRKRAFDENVSEGQEETNEEGEDDNENDFFEDEEMVDVEGREEEERLNESAEEGVKKDENQKGGQKKKLQCDRCNRYFANHNSMNAHRFKVHRVVIRASVKCPGCEHRATTIHTLNEHVADEHGIKLQYVKRKFKNTGEFQNYLDDLAVTRNMGFVLHRKSENKRQLYCNRSGAIRVNKGGSLRNRPRKGTAKIGAMCPAHLFYTECDDGSIEVNGQLTHFGHTLDPRFVFPATSSEKVSARVRLTRPKRDLLHRTVPVDLQDHNKGTGSDDGSFVNVDNDNTNGFDESRAGHREESEIALEQRYGPLHPNSDEIDIRMKNIDRLCSFLFDNVSEQLYRLNDETMDMVLRALRTTQNSISNLNSMMIQIKEGDPDVVQKFQRRGPGSRYAQWLPSFANISDRVRTDSASSFFFFSFPVAVLWSVTSSRQQRRQMYDTEDYDEDTVYYRHVPLRTTDEYENVYVVDEGQVETAGEVETGEEYYETY